MLAHELTDKDSVQERMTMMKKKLLLMLAVLLIVSAIIPVSAALAEDEQADSQVEITRGPVCPGCYPAVGMIAVHGTWTPWAYNGGKRDCPKIWYMVDNQQEQQRTVHYRCPKCQYTYYSHTETAYRWICGH